MSIKISIDGLDKLQRKLGNASNELADTMHAAGEETAKELLGTTGLQKYPPATAANQPPPPFYIRGRGMQRSPTVNDGRSERLGTRWVVSRWQRLGVKIVNAASYAPFVHGKEQARNMGDKGWRKLEDVAKDKRDKIRDIYQAWVDRLLKKVGI